jgi:hypothetical protein
MLSPRPPSVPADAPRLRLAWAGVFWLACALIPGTAAALDGRADVRVAHQEGRSGDQKIESDERREIYSLEQMRQLWGRSTFQLHYLVRRDLLTGSVAGTSVDNRLVAQTPAASFSWLAEGFRANLHGRANRTDQQQAGLPNLRDESLEYGLWSSARRGALDLDLSWSRNASQRRGADADRENRESVGTANVRWQASAHDNVQARLSRIDLNSVTSGLRTTFRNAHVSWQGDRSLVGGRGRVSWHVMQSRFEQRDRIAGASGLRYLPPAAGGFWVDDTPSLLDPLEPQPEAVPALFDNDRTTRTVINLGDNAPRGRDYGGDYRNIYLDFGEPVAMDAAFLRVDRRLTFIADLIQWDLYVSDDAENRDWGQPLPPGAWSARYVELETGDQGWEISFTTTLVHRRLKLVDRKLGATMDDLFVTEFEVLQTMDTTGPESRRDQDRTLLQGEADYHPHARLHLRYHTLFDRRVQTGSGALDRLHHGTAANWRLGTWLASAHAQWSDEQTPSRLDSRANSQMVSLTRQARDRLTARVAWSRAADDNYDARFATQSVTLDASWRAAPALTFSQRVARGWRSSESGTADSDSWVTTSEIRSVPRPGLRIDLNRANRWVGREAGPGFTSYNTTQVDAHWEIAPQLSVWSQYTSQERAEGDWILRSSAAWTPLRGGSVLVTLQANDYQDSRIAQLRRGGGVSVDWQARPRLFLSGGAEKHYEKFEGRRSRPLSFQARGYWTF